MKKHFVVLAVMTAGIVLLATTVSEAQRRQRGQRGGFGRGRSGGGAFGLLSTNAYLQKEISLTSSQLKRIKEIELQMQGGRALARDEVAKELGLSDGQKEKIQKAQRSAFEALRGAFRPGGGQRPNFDEIRKRFAKAREKADKAAMDVLTSSQKAKWKKMLGKPIDREKLQRRREGGRRPRPDV
ncbi:MAG: hypothetical protein ACE5KM_18275 [Planctomycetaceae bacterium]